jgi:hypothetical protein
MTWYWKIEDTFKLYISKIKIKDKKNKKKGGKKENKLTIEFETEGENVRNKGGKNNLKRHFE